VLANAAVTDAYAGRLDRAEARARRALALQSDDPLVINALGVVLFRRGKHAEAAQVFGSGLENAVGPTSVALGFNRGRSLHAAGDTAAAEKLLRAVLEYESAGPWADETRRLLQRAPRAAGSAPDAPSIRLTGSGAALQVGTTTAEVRRRLGAPSSVERSGATTLWHFDAAGVVAAFDESGRAVMFSLLRRAAGEIDGVHVGDNLRQVEAAWGPPSGGDATARMWQDGSGVARLVQVLDDAVHTTMLVRAAT
jgi:tetratricopeptide (TPR) repeat protein